MVLVDATPRLPPLPLGPAGGVPVRCIIGDYEGADICRKEGERSYVKSERRGMKKGPDRAGEGGERGRYKGDESQSEEGEDRIKDGVGRC